MEDVEAIVREFLVESRENLEQTDRDLVELEKEPRDRERLVSVFRAVHTIKGMCGFLGFAKLGAVSHVGESLLSRLRDGQIALTPAVSGALLALVDALRELLRLIESTGNEGVADYASLIETLTRLTDGKFASPAEDLLAPAAATPAPAPVTDGTVRVDVGLLDRLMDLVGELVLVRNQMLQLIGTRGDAGLSHASQRLNLITTDIQKTVIKTRMLPVSRLFRTFPRMVRDVSVQCGKPVELHVEGGDTELDRSLLEAIKDPLAHLLRNAIDHGIEDAAVRLQRGKPALGRLQLRAFHEGGQVHIEVSDDGGGIDPERVRRKAVERGLLTPTQAAQIAPDELLQLVFLPGFTTAAAVTSLSGRGVGMDVVKTNIERIGGSVRLTSEPGRGATVAITIPLTLAIINALLVTAGGDRYAIPQVNLVELVRVPTGRIEYVHGSPVCRLRERLLPLLDLGRELGVEPAGGDGETIDLVVVRADRRTFGLVVSTLRDTEEIVVKPLGALLKGLPVYAGATILGDGRVALILDIPGLARRGGVLPERADSGDRDETSARPTEIQPCRTVLVFRAGRDGRFALPLSPVARLEEFPAAGIERSLGREVVQYRGRILPLVRLAELLGRQPSDGDDPIVVPTIVCVHDGFALGLIIDRIVDIVETPLRVEPTNGSPGVSGRAIIQGRVTDILDVADVLDRATAHTGGRS